MSNEVTRRISNATWNAIVATGFVSRTRLSVLEFVYNNGPVTISQALAALQSKRDSSVNARFSELVKMELIEIIGTTPDPEGKQEVSIYDMTGRMPVKLKKDTGLACLRFKDYNVCIVFDSDTTPSAIEKWKRFLTKHLPSAEPAFELTRVKQLKTLK